MLRLLGFILVLGIGFGAGWIGRSYRATDACQANGGTYDTNRGVCAGIASTAPLRPPAVAGP